jgi:hypothetical protein
MIDICDQCKDDSFRREEALRRANKQ